MCEAILLALPWFRYRSETILTIPPSPYERTSIGWIAVRSARYVARVSFSPLQKSLSYFTKLKLIEFHSAIRDCRFPHICSKIKVYRIPFLALRDENVVRLLGICSQHPKLMVVEYMENGDLHHFLSHQSPPYIGGEDMLTTEQLVHMAQQVLNQQPSSKRFLKRK